MNTSTKTTNHLQSITTRQSQSRLRDLFFAACVTLAAAISIVSVGAAASAASAPEIAHR
jgi:fatty acid desaturase